MRSWTYQLQHLDDPALLASPADLLVIDYSFDGSEPRELWPVEVSRFKQKPDGTRRLVLAYLSIGEAEDYRFYWEAAWDVSRPAWMLPDTCRWQGNHVVHFWRPDWKRIIFQGRFGYLERIQLAGFDGVYLDRADAHAQLATVRPDARAQMIAFVLELAAAARARQPGFLVVVQNAEELLSSAAFRRAVDAVAKEDLLFGLAGDGHRNPPAEVRSSVADLRRLRSDGKPVLTVEYLSDPAAIAAARREHMRLGFVPTFAGRDLLGGPVPGAPPPQQIAHAPRDAACDATGHAVGHP